MILVYPMLTSTSVNPKILPGIVKSIEKYIIVHNTDEVLRHMNNSITQIVKGGVQGGLTAAIALTLAGYLAKSGGKTSTSGGGASTHRIVKKGKNLELKEQGYPNSAGSVRTSGKPQIDPKQAGQTQQNIARGITQAVNNAKVSRVDMPKQDTIALEPTYVQVQTDSGVRLIGVKVIPVMVESTSGMVGVLMADTELKKGQYLANKFGRAAARVFHRTLRRLPGMKGKAVTGDIKKDIIFAESQYGQNTYVCFSKMDFDRDVAFTSPAAVQRLYKLGWASIIITDDVDKEATFCMKHYGGVCSTVPYSFIYSSLGSEHSKVYKDLEDANRSAGPFFRKNITSKRKVLQK